MRRRCDFDPPEAVCAWHHQCNGNIIDRCAVIQNSDKGVSFDGYVGQCDGNTIQENRIMGNAERGIRVNRGVGNRIEANTIWGTTRGTNYGIQTVSTTSNFILKNTCVGHTYNFALSTYGPIVTTVGQLAGTDPWANLSR